MKKFKKTLAYLLALTCCFSGVATFGVNSGYSVKAHAETEEKAYKDWSYVAYDKIEGVCDTPCIEITSYNKGAQWEDDIPSEIDGLPVVSISGDTFSKNRVFHLNIPSSLKYFGDGFLNNLTNCTITIDNKFEFSMNLISNPLGSYKDDLIPDSFKLTYAYPSYDDKGNKIIEDIEVPETVCGLPVTSISDDAFANNQNIKAVKLPDTISYFGRTIFQNSSVESVNIPKSLKVIPSNTFKGCTKLKSVDFHENLIVAHSTFKDTDFKVPDNIMVSEDNNFVSNSYSPITKKKYGDFDIVVYGDYTANSYYCTIASYNPDNLPENPVDLVFPESFFEVPIISVDEGLWKELNVSGIDVNSITFPSGMTTIDMIKLNNPQTVTSITINAKDITLGQGIFKNTGIEEISLNGSCEIEDNVFSGCKNLKKVTFSGDNPVINLEHDAFRNCTSLEQVIFPENMTANFTIDSFGYCSALKELNLNGKINVNSQAFRECDSLETITLDGDITLHTDAFYGCDSLSNIVIDTDKTITGSAFDGCHNLMNINSIPVFNTSEKNFNKEINDFIFNNFNGADDVGFINLYVMEQINNVVEEYITDDMTEMQKVKTLHDWVCNNIVYDYDNTSDYKNHNDASIFMNDSTVCEGYAKCYNLLLNAAGIESYYLLSENHAWNIVKIGGHYFHSDTTWDDGDNISHDWFLKSDIDAMAETGSHASWKLFKPSTLHSFQKETLPECKYNMGDINTDGRTSIADLVVLNKYLMGQDTISADDIVLSDLTYDGVTDVFDLVLMRQLLIKK